MDETPTALPPEEAFGLLANATRMNILRALWEAPDHEATFSDLRGAVGMRDSGQFNYHLSKLVGRFVAHTEVGYRLRIAGERVMGAVLSGEYTHEATVEPVPIDAACQVCGGGLVAAYRDEAAILECGDCAVQHGGFPLPPGALEPYDRTAFPAVMDRYFRTLLRQVTAGFCPTCSGRLTPNIESVAYPEFDTPPTLVAIYDCERCGEHYDIMLGGCLLEHPVVVGFCLDHGVDVTERPLWRHEWLFDADHAVLVDAPDAAAEVRVPGGDETLVVRVDDTLRVVGHERVSS